MRNISCYLKKITASSLAVIFLSFPNTGIALAAKHEPPPPPPHKDKMHHDRHDHHWKDKDDKDTNGNAVTGFIVGAVVGAIVAKNT